MNLRQEVRATGAVAKFVPTRQKSPATAISRHHDEFSFRIHSAKRSCCQGRFTMQHNIMSVFCPEAHNRPTEANTPDSGFDVTVSDPSPLPNLFASSGPVEFMIERSIFLDSPSWTAETRICCIVQRQIVPERAARAISWGVFRENADGARWVPGARSPGIGLTVDLRHHRVQKNSTPRTCSEIIRRLSHYVTKCNGAHAPATVGEFLPW